MGLNPNSNVAMVLTVIPTDALTNFRNINYDATTRTPTTTPQ
jgi:hypothetical protein